MERQGLALIQGVIRQQVKNDPTFAEGIGFNRLCRDYKLYDLIQAKPHQFITIALPIEYSINKLKNQITKKINKWLSGSKCVVERYSKSGDNLHIHILKEGIYSKPKIIRDLSRKFKIDKNFVDVRSSTKKVDYDNRVKYISGNKNDEIKMEHVEKDAVWRKENDLEDIYNL